MKQKEKKRIASKLFAALVVLTLISCCFVGTTFARYTSSDSGVATVTVANWSIAFENGDQQNLEDNLTIANLSPCDEDFTSDNRKNSTGRVMVAQLWNRGEVDALVTITTSGVSFTYNQVTDINSFADAQTAWNNTHDDNLDIDNEGQLFDLFSIKFYDAPKDGNELTVGDEFTIAHGDGRNIYAEVTWTTNDSQSSVGNTSWADALDTFVGTYVGAVNWTVTYTAVQSSEIPETDHS